jgi:hypothetical protein
MERDQNGAEGRGYRHRIMASKRTGQRVSSRPCSGRNGLVVAVVEVAPMPVRWQRSISAAARGQGCEADEGADMPVD